MVTNIRLPAEILTAILEKVDVQDLWHVRMASCTLCAAVNPIVFRKLFVESTRENVQNIGGLLDVPDIAVHIREVFYIGINDHWDPRHCASSSLHFIYLIMIFAHRLTVGHITVVSWHYSQQHRPGKFVFQVSFSCTPVNPARDDQLVVCPKV